MVAACREGVSVNRWCEMHGIPHSALYHQTMPTVGTIYAVCDAAGIKASDHFKEMGR